MEHLHASGKARSIGVSNFTIRHLEELLKQSKIVPAVNQVKTHPFLSQVELRAYCASKQILIEAYSPLTHGKRLDDRQLLQIAKRYAKSTAQIPIRWCLQHGMVVLPKSVNPERIKENGSIFDFEITAEDMTLLDSLNENLRTCWDPTDAP